MRKPMHDGPDNLKLTPAMRQYVQFKRQYPEAVLFFRMGDFYETFYEDAKLCSRVLGIALTSRNKGEDPVPLAGVPYHAVNSYLNKMIKAGYKVAICEQMEDPAQAKGVVKRDVVRLVTPGTLTEETLLDERCGNYLAAVCIRGGGKSGNSRNSNAGLSWVDLSTGQFFTETIEERYLLDELVRLRPSECLVSEEREELPAHFEEQVAQLTGAVMTRRAGWLFDARQGQETLTKHFQTASLEGFGFTEMNAGIAAAGVILDYLNETQKIALSHITRLRNVSRERFLQLDRTTLRSLEIERTIRDSGREGSLLHSIDKTLTAMGARKLRMWLCYPLCDLANIEKRQDAIAEMLPADELREQLRRELSEVADMERIASRISTGRASPRDLLGLAKALRQMPRIKKLLKGCTAQLWMELAEQCEDLNKTADLIESAIDPGAGLSYRDGGVIRGGYDEEVDRLRSLCRDGQQWLGQYQKKLIEQTGFGNLKVGFNKVFGYYVEVSHAFRGELPGDFVRKQTIKNAERYITDELKKYEHEVLTAEQRSKQREEQIFQEIRQAAAGQTLHLQQTADAVAKIDVLAAMAQMARQRNYCRPVMTEDTTLEIREGRHPVLDCTLTESFVPNDLSLGDGNGEIHIITGPNMSGKSTYIRQAALLAILAQTGSFIPARSAKIGLVDRIFTRIGASDELTRGQSTFMVEMIETANILNNATSRSLVILDEIGRGTSTYDGLALAWAVTEHIAAKIRCRTLFATHYHEITELADLLDNVKNSNVAVREWKGEVVFLHKIVPGRTDKSYGIHVAQMAGIPQEVIRRSKEILQELENNFSREAHTAQLGGQIKKSNNGQLTLFDNLPPDPILEKLRQTDIDHLTPIQAINLLEQIKQELENR